MLVEAAFLLLGLMLAEAIFFVNRHIFKLFFLLFRG